MNKITIPLPDVLARVELEPDALALVQGKASVAEALDALEAAEQWMPAIRIMGQALPAREAVWWACVCARKVPDPEATPADLAALQAADGWVRRPSEEHRRAAMAAADATEKRSPEAWAAIGAFWSGGSLGPANLPEIPPAPELRGIAVASSVLLAAVRGEPTKAAERYPAFITSARDIAAGGAG
jgi:hypothetical protein